MNNRQQGNLSSPCYWSLILSQKGSCFGLVSLFCNSEFKLYLLAQVGEQRLHIFALDKRINWKISFSPIGPSWTPQTWPGSLCSFSYWTAPVRTKVERLRIDKMKKREYELTTPPTNGSAKPLLLFLSNQTWTPATLLMKNLWRTSAEPLRVVLAPSPSLSVLFSDTASAIETTALNHSFMPIWLSGGKIHHFWIESQGEGTTAFLVQAVAASRLRRSLHACIVAGFFRTNRLRRASTAQ